MNDRLLPSHVRGADALALRNDARLPAWYDEAQEEQSGGFNLQLLLSLLYRWRFLFGSIVLGTLVAAAIWLALQTPLYRATATLELNPAPTQVVKTEDSEEARQTDRDFLALQIGLIKSRAVAERVARALNLGQDEAFLGEKPAGRRDDQAATSRLLESFSATGTSSDRIMQVSFVHPDPAVAARVVNGFANQAVESYFERNYAATARSREFLQRRLETTRRELEASERQLIDYARQARIVNVVSEDTATSGDSAGGTLIASNLVALNQQLADAQNARIIAQQRYAQSGAAATAAAVANSTVQALQQQRAQLQADYEDKSQRYLPDHPELVNLRGRISGFDRQIAAASSQSSSSVRDTLRAEMIAAQNRERELQSRINSLQSGLLDLNDRGVRYTILKRSVDANRSLYNSLLAQLGSENTSGTRSAGIALVDPAQVPGSPFSPSVPRTLILALLGGLVLGGAGVMAADRWYDTINVPDDIKSLLGLPVLGTIPLAGKNEVVDDLIADPRSRVAEAYHSTRTALQFAVSGGAPKSILFTSARPNEGKTSCAIALAADFRSVGRSVIVVDADLRKPSLQGESPGLTAVLAGASSQADAILSTPTPGLALLPAGRRPPNPTTLLNSRAMEELVRSLEREFDIVIIDGPPVMGFADAPLLAAIVEASVLVIEAGGTSRSVAKDAINRLQATGGVVAGAILTKFDYTASGMGAYGYEKYAYSYAYGGDTKKRALIGPPVAEEVDA